MDPPSAEAAGIPALSAAESVVDETVTSCCICFVPDAFTDEDDPVLICEGCDINVHMSCYGLAGRAVPKGDWFCELCRAGLQEALPGRMRIAADLSVKLPAGALQFIFAPACCMILHAWYYVIQTHGRGLGGVPLLLCADTNIESLKEPLRTFRSRYQCPVCPMPSGMPFSSLRRCVDEVGLSSHIALYFDLN
jgi:hypothetical protein